MVALEIVGATGAPVPRRPCLGILPVLEVQRDSLGVTDAPGRDMDPKTFYSFPRLRPEQLLAGFLVNKVAVEFVDKIKPIQQLV